MQAVRHVGFEDLGSFEAIFQNAGYDIEYVDVARRDLSAIDPLQADLLVVLGGPIGVNDAEAYPVIKHELDLLKARLGADRPTMGICLGAQLMAAALGAAVYPGPRKEICWSALDLSADRFEHWLLGHASELATARISPVALRRDTQRYGERLEIASAALLRDWLALIEH